MDNPSFQESDSPAYRTRSRTANGASERKSGLPASSANFPESYSISTYEKRVGMAEAMEELRRTIGPDAFSAPLNQGELNTKDKFSLAFLIGFPCVFFVLGIVLTSLLRPTELIGRSTLGRLLRS